MNGITPVNSLASFVHLPTHTESLQCYPLPMLLCTTSIYVMIFRNSDEWWTGINDKDGQFGHFQASQVIPVKNNLKSK